MNPLEIERLIFLCKQLQDSLKIELKSRLEKMGREVIDEAGFLYSPGRKPIMLVAHLDIVHEKRPSFVAPEDILTCDEGIGGDDRCGVYIILRLLEMGHDCHVLFCEDEEIGQVGAGKFCKSGIFPDLHYIVEFDRRGEDDAVFYDCKNRKFIDFITAGFGFREEYGSGSDISTVAPHLGVAAVNLSSGYRNAHNPGEEIDTAAVERIIAKASTLLDADSVRYGYETNQPERV